MCLPVVWLTGVGYTAMFWSLQTHPLRQAFTTNGSSLLTLGFASVEDLPSTVLAFTEAVIGLVLLALLITYLPSMYAAFSRREALVAMNAIQAGTPPSAVEMLERFHRLSDLDRLDVEVWHPWAKWFVDVAESHTSLAALPFFRSPDHRRSWVTAAGVVLDAAALASSTLDIERSGGRRLLRHTARPRARPPRPHQRHPGGVRRRVRPPGRVGRPAAGRHRAGVARLRRLAGQLRRRTRGPGCLVVAPPAQWSSDRVTAASAVHPPVRRRSPRR